MRLVWRRLTWHEKTGEMYDRFGNVDELLSLWETLRSRGLSEAYFAELGRLLNIHPPFTPEHVLQIAAADEVNVHWVAALRAVGVEVEL